MSPESRSAQPGPSRRSVLKAGAGLAAGAGLLGSASTPASAAPRAPARLRTGQTGTPLCDRPGDSASAQGLGSGDLCIPYFREHDGTWGYVFGDSFTDIQQYGAWMSPVMLCQQSFDATGAAPIGFTWSEPNGGPAAQLFDYAHNADNGWGPEVTRIPNDCIEINGRTFIQYTSIDNWDTTGDGSRMAGIAYSDDYGATWTDFPYHWDGSARGIDQSLYMMWSFAGIDPDGWLYVYSKRWNGSHRNAGDGGAIQLFRFRPDDFGNGDFGAQQNWAWDGNAWGWTSSAAPSIMLSGNNIGEFSVKRIHGTYVMSYFDCDDYSIRTRTAPRPDAVWTAPRSQIAGDNTVPQHWGLPQVPNLYGGYIHPGSSSATSLTLIVSQWPGAVHSPPYWALQFDGINP